MHTANVHNEESHVRDNIYCAMGVWALALAYRCVMLNTKPAIQSVQLTTCNVFGTKLTL